MKYMIFVFAITLILFHPRVSKAENSDADYAKEEIVGEFTELVDSQDQTPISSTERDLRQQEGIDTRGAFVSDEAIENTLASEETVTKVAPPTKSPQVAPQTANQKPELETLQAQKAALVQELKKRESVLQLKRDIASLKNKLSTKLPAAKHSSSIKKTTPGKQAHLAFQEHIFSNPF